MTGRRFYFKRLFLGDLASKAAGLLKSFTASRLTESHDWPGCARALWSSSGSVMVINGTLLLHACSAHTSLMQDAVRMDKE